MNTPGSSELQVYQGPLLEEEYEQAAKSMGLSKNPTKPKLRYLHPFASRHHRAVEVLARNNFSAKSALDEKDQQIEQMGIDSVTDLLNRKGYENELIKREERFKRHGRPEDEPTFTTVIMVIDLDRFKPINDTYGHPVGDMMLHAVAKVIKTQLRDGDIIARPGGDEFEVIADIPGKQADNQQYAEKIIMRMREAMQSVIISYQGEELEVSGRVGAVIRDKNCIGADLVNAVKQADKNMYEEKEKRD